MTRRPRHSASRAGGAIRFGNDDLFGQERRQAKKCRERMGDDVGGYSRKEGAHTTLVFEAAAKRAGGKTRTELRHDAASYVDSTARTERQGKIAGDGSEHGTEHLDGFTAVRFLFANLRICDLRGRVGSSRNAVDLSERVVEVDEAGTRQEPFGRDVIEARAHVVKHNALAGRRWRHSGVSALAGQREPAVAHRDQPPDAAAPTPTHHAPRRS